MTWLDFDEREAEQFREIIAAFDEKGTLDPIGIGSVRDAIADLLFPGISTIQTRARYLVFVPRMCRALENQRVLPAAFAERLRRLEAALIEALIRGGEGEGEGVIGYRVRAQVSTLPSAIYWNGMLVFGIRKFPHSRSEYGRSLHRFHRALASIGHDDEGEPVGEMPSNWDPDLPRLDEPPRDTERFGLTADEADYLKERIRLSAPGSLLSLMLADGNSWHEAEAPWEMTLRGASAELRGLVAHAERFSLLIHGAQLTYNLLLAERARSELDAGVAGALVEGQREALAAWAAAVEQRRPELDVWTDGLADFWVAITRRGARRIAAPTRSFTRDWILGALADPRNAADQPGLRQRIVQREQQLKGPLAKLTNRRALETWSLEPQANYRLSFRWGNAARIARDIVDGLEAQA